jgi:hypothetical protein
MWHAWGKKEKYFERFWWERPKERDHSKYRGLDESMGSEWIFGRLAGGWSGFSWPRMTGGGLF